MLHRIFIGTVLFLFLTLVGLITYIAFQPQKLPIGSPMPEIDYLAESTIKRLQPDTARMTMIVYFHSDCEHCQYQLQTFHDNLSAFQNTQIILLTCEEDFFAKGRMKNWPNLTKMSNITWGIVSSQQLTKNFGARITPTIYIFNRTGTLSSTIKGEAKLEKILMELRKNSGSGTPSQRLHN